ncbi:Hypothetical protein CAP_1712 [Chondromyces apiculatus DSM 436]|uniref:Uncharacterized protein n=2 Tax=Chondromyces apiculatus TaxID=51 RepID=A0A017TCG7_9BACT|nr:Hypothetical protein CAP_1712 [Chondromyces apiculatus DSM 436]
MVEALVAIPFFILMFICMVFIGDLYRSKLQTHRSSLELAWADSLAGCDTTTRGPMPVSANIDLKDAAGAPGAALCEDGFGILTETVQGGVNRPSPLPSGITQTTTTTTLICNEKPETGDFDGAADFLWNLYAPPELKTVSP